MTDLNMADHPSRYESDLGAPKYSLTKRNLKNTLTEKREPITDKHAADIANTLEGTGKIIPLGKIATLQDDFNIIDTRSQEEIQLHNDSYNTLTTEEATKEAVRLAA